MILTGVIVIGGLILVGFMLYQILKGKEKWNGNIQENILSNGLYINF